MSEQLSLRENLTEKGYGPVGIELGKSDIQTAIERYRAFLQIGEEYQEATRYYNTDRGDGDFGQYQRVAGAIGERGVVQDNKDIFHFGAQTRQIIEARLNGNIPAEMKDFLNCAEEIFWAGQRTKRNALEELDYKQTGLIGIMLPEKETMNDVLRFILYYENEDKLAKGHFDRSTTTLAIAESHEGLRMTAGQNGLSLDVDQEYMEQLEQNLVPVVHKEHEAKFFLGAGWNRLPGHLKAGNETMKLGWHDVIEPNTRVDNEVMRWAVVMFNNPHCQFREYTVPTQAETRPYKQLGRIAV